MYVIKQSSGKTNQHMESEFRIAVNHHASKTIKSLIRLSADMRRELFVESCSACGSLKSILEIDVAQMRGLLPLVFN